VAIIWLAQLDSSENQTPLQKPSGNRAIVVEASLPKAKPTRRPDNVHNSLDSLFDLEATPVELAPSSSVSPAKNVVGQTMYVDASRLNVRNGPSKTDKVVWTVKRDEAVVVTKVSGDWSFIAGSRYEGWVYGGYLTRNKAPQQLVSLQPKSLPTVHRQPGLTEAAITKLLIERSHAYYSGNCPCPYNSDRAGRRCGGRSAYSRPGGASPLCYPSDISATMISDYQARQ